MRDNKANSECFKKHDNPYIINYIIPGVSSISMKCSSSAVEVSSGNSNTARRAFRRGALGKNEHKRFDLQ
jgi:precorrin-2 methylase